MKILLVGPIPPPNGGMAMQTRQLLRLLEEHGHDVTMLAVNPPYRPVFIGKIPVLRSLFRLVPYFFALKSAMKAKDVVHVMANSGWAFHLFARPALYIASKAGVPAVVNYRGGKARQFFEASWSRISASFDRAAAITVPSGFLDEVFGDFGKATKVVPNIIDLSLFPYAPRVLNTDNLHIIVTRNLEAIYDNGTAISAFAHIHKKYPGAKLTVAGSGPLLSKLQAQVAELNLSQHVTFAGRLDRSHMAKLYADADIMLNPSTIDNMPNSVLEAMASGCLVVSTNVGGIPYMVDHEKEALLVAPENADLMADAIERLIDTPELVERLNQSGKAKVEQYRPDNVIPVWEEVYAEVMK